MKNYRLGQLTNKANRGLYVGKARWPPDCYYLSGVAVRFHGNSPKSSIYLGFSYEDSRALKYVAEIPSCSTGEVESY